MNTKLFVSIFLVVYLAGCTKPFTAPAEDKSVVDDAGRFSIEHTSDQGTRSSDVSTAVEAGG